LILIATLYKKGKREMESEYFRFVFIFFETGSCYVAQAILEFAYVAQAGLKLAILLLLFPECWDYRYA
jgi:hypothetical protein